MASELRHTPLHEQHVAAGARLVPFAGWEMPVVYQGVTPEHLAVRSGCGIFDVSHMGQVEVSGSQALDLLQRALSNDVARMDVGGAQYSVLCRPDGGILDDAFSYRLADDRFLTVTNAANHERDAGWIAGLGEDFDADVRDVAEEWAMLAVQGPKARDLVAALATAQLPPRMRTATVGLRPAAGGGTALICGTGYTGEDGVEILCAPEDAPRLWERLVEAGATPAGLAARDTLRLEACLHLYGNDMDIDRNPIEAGLGWCCKEETGFVGSEAVAAARRAGAAERLVPIVITSRGIPRHGNPVMSGSERVGTVTSGTMSPSLGYGIGMAYVRSDLAEPGTEIEIDVRGRRRAARVDRRPLYEPESG